MCACRDGAAACQKRREWGLIAGGDSGPSVFLEFSKPLSPGVCENAACEPHYCSCIGALDSAISGPIGAFSANSGSIICNEAPLWRFLPTSSADSFCRALLLGLPIGFQTSASAKGSGQALARGVPAMGRCKGFCGVFRMIFCDGKRSTFRNENLVFAPGLGCRPAAKISRLRLGRSTFRNETPCLRRSQ